MKKITLITIVVFIIAFMACGLCFAASDDNYERTTQAPGGKAYIVNKASDKNVYLFQPITDLLSLQNKNEHLNTNRDYSGDAVATPDAIGSSVFGIYPRLDDPDNPEGDPDEGLNMLSPKEFGQEVQLIENNIGDGNVDTLESTSLELETGSESEINLGAEDEDFGVEAGEELINLNERSIK